MRPDEALKSGVPAQTTARWVAGLFLLVVLLQRFVIPGTPVALLVPAVLVWGGWALHRGIVVIDRNRAMLWLAAFAATALVIPLQGGLVPGARISLTSWGLFMVVWVPFMLRLVDRRRGTYLLMLLAVTRVCFWLAAANIAMFGTQLAGFRYVDWFARIVPDAFELSGFILTYPVSYGSDIYRGNAWIGLEPSFVSLQLGLGVLAAIYTASSAWTLTVLLLGLVATISGSGFAIVGVGLLVIVVHPARSVLRRYVPVAAGVAFAASNSSFGLVLLERVTELQSSQSSASLRAIEPYRFLWPLWVRDLPTILLGKGPGSSQRIVEETGILGLLVPSPVKVFFDYGLLAGVVLLVFLLGCYLAGPSRGFATSLLASLWLLQPGTTTLLTVAPVLVFVTLWSPRPSPPLEVEPELVPAGHRRKTAPRARVSSTISW